jgi:hypothetical protein
MAGYLVIPPNAPMINSWHRGGASRPFIAPLMAPPAPWSCPPSFGLGLKERERERERERTASLLQWKSLCVEARVLWRQVHALWLGAMQLETRRFSYLVTETDGRKPKCPLRDNTFHPHLVKTAHLPHNIVTIDKVKLSLSSIPGRHMGECKYSSTILDLSTRWRCVVSLTPRPLYPPGRKSPR